MGPLGWFLTFLILGLLALGVTAWMGWYARRSMEEHRNQVKEILAEMHAIMEEERARGEDDDEGAALPASGTEEDAAAVRKSTGADGRGGTESVPEEGGDGTPGRSDGPSGRGPQSP